MNHNTPRLFIGTPTHICKRYCAREFMSALESHSPPGTMLYILSNSKGSPAPYYNMYNVQGNILSYSFQHLGDRLQGTHFEIESYYYGHPWSIHARLAHVLNAMRSEFLKTDCTHYLSLEADCIVESQTIETLLDRNLPVVMADCYEGFHSTLTELTEVDRVTLGCTLIKREVLEDIRFYYCSDMLAAFPDAFFSADCVAKEIKLYYDPEAKCTHRHDIRGLRGWQDLPSSETECIS